MRRLIITAVATTATALAVAGPASASVTYNPDGTGFVGKGDVQTAFTLNNNALQLALQKDAQAVKFKYEQPASQTVTEDAKQIGTQTASQVVKRTVSCVVVTGSDRNLVEHERYGSRSGTRDGERSGTRTGTRYGTVSGTLASAIDGLPRSGQNQFTGFILKGKTGTPTFQPDAAAVDWDGETLDGTKYDDPSMSVIEWGGWGENSDPTENPASCLSGNSNVEELSDKTVEFPIEYGEMEFGPVEYSNPQYGPVTTTGTGTLLASYNSSAFKTIWPMPVA